MARARSLKPAIFKNEVLGTADLIYTVLFEGLWTLADREGRLEDRPLRIKAELFPYRDGIDVDDALGWLHDQGFIVRYQAEGGRYIAVLNFLKHQKPHKNEQKSDIPAPTLGKSHGRRVRAATANGGTTTDQGTTKVVPTPANGGSPPASSLTPLTLLSDSLDPGSGKGRAEPEAGPPTEAGHPLPFTSPGFVEAWGRWKQHRKERRQPLTPTSVKQQFSELAEMGEARAVAAINHSIAKSYQGIYEPNGQRAPPADTMQQAKDNGNEFIRLTSGKKP